MSNKRKDKKREKIEFRMKVLEGYLQRMASEYFGEEVTIMYIKGGKLKARKVD